MLSPPATCVTLAKLLIYKECLNWHSRCNVIGTWGYLAEQAMKKNGSVVGWVLEADRTKLLVREASGRVSAQKSNSDDEFGPRAIQTGAFLRGKQVLDPITKELIRYEFEQVSSGAIV